MADNLVRLRPEKDVGRASERKWGIRGGITLGFRVVPSLLLRTQNCLGLNPTQFAVLMQVRDFWWERGLKPYPGKAVLAERLDLSARQVRRDIADLETAGLFKHFERRATHAES
ncbi:MAG: helix-turn-helix domain-containing protein [Rhodobacter sp.]|nr:helix-turn-helix domain-containing protein [Rhodobacter sp.]MCY4169257.1 helix-turn-helix domain-containing protein [Rhodobacter sp.]MCY4240147.1 helix-turn-helix domain-containing protein [Rhodobacter sp.]